MSQQEHVETWRLLIPEEVGRREARKEAAIRAAQGTPGTRTQHVRLSIDFHITIAGSPPNDDGLNEPDPAYHARQARLLAAVRSNPAVLKQWMCATRSRRNVCLSKGICHETSCFTRSILPGHAIVATQWYEAPGTMKPQPQDWH